MSVFFVECMTQRLPQILSAIDNSQFICNDVLQYVKKAELKKSH